ncbi:MAG TPA: hypothetical protein VGD26_02705 [Chitinophagaceae bacterium]
MWSKPKTSIQSLPVDLKILMNFQVQQKPAIFNALERYHYTRAFCRGRESGGGGVKPIIHLFIDIIRSLPKDRRLESQRHR